MMHPGLEIVFGVIGGTSVFQPAVGDRYALSVAIAWHFRERLPGQTSMNNSGVA